MSRQGCPLNRCRMMQMKTHSTERPSCDRAPKCTQRFKQLFHSPALPQAGVIACPVTNSLKVACTRHDSYSTHVFACCHCDAIVLPWWCSCIAMVMQLYCHGDLLNLHFSIGLSLSLPFAQTLFNSLKGTPFESRGEQGQLCFALMLYLICLKG